ncbi:hypothetical protein [Ruixingdingia sedimenti]|uniref:Uncharacterized protein n=1 Tax=Ruixingdingia sedimenti TaxID=3073604 RepID=A0ABU1F4M3_9RHOB|nr:hypothetical protein [Xinfangfangia sp. LG-4]MDR5651813.1 hypothetical protein [Xinfangfangia sp. LG-4]
MADPNGLPRIAQFAAPGRAAETAALRHPRRSPRRHRPPRPRVQQIFADRWKNGHPKGTGGLGCESFRAIESQHLGMQDEGRTKAALSQDSISRNGTGKK